MKAITLHQPWATFIKSGLKMTETRLHDRFKNLLNKRIAIHAGKQFDKSFHFHTDYLCDCFSTERLSEINKAVIQSVNEHGLVLCTAFVKEVRWLKSNDSEKAMIDCLNTKRFGLFLSDIEPLKKPFACKGKQGIFNIDDSYFERIK